MQTLFNWMGAAAVRKYVFLTALMYAAWQYGIDLVNSIGVSFINYAKEFIVELQFDFTPYTQFLVISGEVFYLLEYYTPFTETVALLGFYYGFKLAVIGVRLALGAIPTIM